MQEATEKSRKITSKGQEKNREKGKVQETPKKSRKMTSEGLGKERENAQKSGNNRKGRNSKMTAEAKEVNADFYKLSD
jgi:hypothetical protein